MRDHGEHPEPDRRLPAAHHAAVSGDRRAGARRLGAVTAVTWRPPPSLRSRRAAWERCPGSGRRKIARTSGGAAMNSTISDCTTSTMSIGMPLRRLHRVAAGLQRAEQQAGDEDAHGPGPAEQRDRDRVEADARVDARGEAGGDRAEHLGDAGEADEAARDDHRVDVDRARRRCPRPARRAGSRRRRGTGSRGSTGRSATRRRRSPRSTRMKPKLRLYESPSSFGKTAVGSIGGRLRVVRARRLQQPRRAQEVARSGRSAT